MLTDEELLAHIYETFPTLNGWEARLKHPFTAVPGSELSFDDEDWPHRPLSQVVWSLLGSAKDHAMAFGEALVEHRLHPWADRTLIRSAIIAGAAAVWILGPDDPNTRMRHSRAMVADDCMQAKKFIKQLGKEADPGALETIQEQLAALGNVGQINNTDIIAAAAEACGLDGNEALVEWRQTSGAAHGHMWQNMLRWADEGDDPSEGAMTEEQRKASARPGGLISDVTVQGEVGDVANAYMLSFLFQRKAWSLLDRRNATDGGANR